MFNHYGCALKTYRNCLKAFYRVVLSRPPYKILRVPFSDLYGQVSYWHGYGVDETIRVADELVRAGLIPALQSGRLLPGSNNWLLLPMMLPGW